MNSHMDQEAAMKMSNEQAIQILKPFRDMMIDQNGCPISEVVFALDKALEALSAQSEIIRCKDCLIHGVCRFEQYLGLNGFCSHGERREE